MQDDYGDKSDDGDDARYQRNVEPADLDDFKKVTIPRAKLQIWCNEPYFEKAVVGYYVRLAIGRDSKTQLPCYRLCEIVEVETKGEYSFPSSSNQKPVKTNKWVKLKFGDSTKLFKMVQVSDSRPTEDDYRQLMSNLSSREKKSRGILSKKEAAKKRKEQDILISTYTYTTDDIENAIKANKSIVNIGAEKIRVGIAVKAATLALAEAEKRVEELKREKKGSNTHVNDVNIDKLLEDAQNELSKAKNDLDAKKDEEQAILTAELNRKSRIQNSKAKDWSKVNEKARLANAKFDVQSYKAERERQQKEKEGGVVAFDPYKRRKVKPQILWEVGQDKGTTEKPTTIETEKANEKTTIIAPKVAENGKDKDDGTEDKENKNRLPQKPKLVDQIQDLSIDEEVLAKSNITGELQNNSKNIVRARVRKGISLQEYLERKAAGLL
jgi:RNA polymerase-associated protein RTF1